MAEGEGRGCVGVVGCLRGACDRRGTISTGPSSVCCVLFSRANEYSITLHQFGVSAGGGGRSFSALRLPPAVLLRFSSACRPAATPPPCSMRLPPCPSVELSPAFSTTSWPRHGISLIAGNLSIGGWILRGCLFRRTRH